MTGTSWSEGDMAMDAVNVEKTRKECQTMCNEFLAKINMLRCFFEGYQRGMGDIFIDVMIEGLQGMKTKKE